MTDLSVINQLCASDDWVKYAVLIVGGLLWDALFGQTKEGSAVGATVALLKQHPKEGSMSEQKLGVKETKEVLVAGNEVSLFIIKRVKDGIGVDDAVAVYEKLVADDEFKKVVGAAIENIKAVPSEIKDLDLNEGLELGMFQAMQVPKFVEALKK